MVLLLILILRLFPRSFFSLVDAALVIRHPSRMIEMISSIFHRACPWTDDRDVDFWRPRSRCDRTVGAPSVYAIGIYFIQLMDYNGSEGR